MLICLHIDLRWYSRFFMKCHVNDYYTIRLDDLVWNRDFRTILPKSISRLVLFVWPWQVPLPLCVSTSLVLKWNSNTIYLTGLSQGWSELMHLKQSLAHDRFFSLIFYFCKNVWKTITYSSVVRLKIYVLFRKNMRMLLYFCLLFLAFAGMNFVRLSLRCDRKDYREIHHITNSTIAHYM